MVIHKSTFFGKTPSPIWVKMAQIMLKDPLKMSYKSWLTRPLKIFHGPKNEIFGPVQSSTGIKGATDGMLPLIPPNYPKIPAPDVLQEYKSFSSPFGSFWDLWGYFGLVLGLNLKLLQTSHVTTQNDRKRSRILMEMVSEVTLKTLRPFQGLFCNFWVIFGSFGAILGPKMTWTSWSWVSKPSSSAFCSTCGRFEWSHD